MPENERLLLGGFRFRATTLFLAGALSLGGPALASGGTPRPPVAGQLAFAVHEALGEDLPGFSLIVLLHTRMAESRRQQQTAITELRHLIDAFSGSDAMLRLGLFLPQARNLLDSGIQGERQKQPIAANLALYQYLVPFFQRHQLDCNERVIVQLDAARRIGLTGASYVRSLNHAGLFFEESGLVLDPFDARFRSLGEFAVGRGYGRHDEGSYARTGSRHCLVRPDDAAAICRDLRSDEQPHAVTANEPFASILLDAVAVSAPRDRRRAQALAQLVMEIDPGNAEANDALAGLGSGSAADQHYQSALARDPHDAEIHYNFGVELHHRGDLDGAESEYRAAIRLEPHMLNAIENLGGLLLARADRRDEGRELLCRALVREQSHAQAQRIRRILDATQRCAGE